MKVDNGTRRLAPAIADGKDTAVKSKKQKSERPTFLDPGTPAGQVFKEAVAEAKSIAKALPPATPAAPPARTAADLVPLIKDALANIDTGKRAAGVLLLEARLVVGHGNFKLWIKSNFKLSYSSAKAYMRKAEAPVEAGSKQTPLRASPPRQKQVHKAKTHAPPSSVWVGKVEEPKGPIIDMKAVSPTQVFTERERLELLIIHRGHEVVKAEGSVNIAQLDAARDRLLDRISSKVV